MGREIHRGRFDDEDFRLFSSRLREETELLRGWFHDGTLSERRGIGGLELEAWLVDAHHRPAERALSPTPP